LFPQASQFNDDLTHRQDQGLEGMLGPLVCRAAAAPVALAQLPPLAAGFTGRDGERRLAADVAVLAYEGDRRRIARKM
jgi:hypothetical protein